MKTIVVTSTRTYGGKTTVGAGLALNSGVATGYLKPLGDRPVYMKDCLVDLDVQVFGSWLGIPAEESACIGFEHEMINQSCGDAGTESILGQRFEQMAAGKGLVIVETGRNYTFGGSLCLDSATLAKAFESEVLLVAEGDPRLIVDKVLAASKTFKTSGVKIAGVIINKLEDDCEDKYDDFIKPAIEAEGLACLGAIPYARTLETAKTSLVLEKLSAKLVAGAGGLEKNIGKVVVGAMSADAAMRMPGFHTKDKIMITGGDRADLILISLDDNTSGLVLTNNIVPNPKILAQAEQKDIPVMSVPMDTYTTAKMVEHIIPEYKPEDNDKKEMVRKLFADNVDHEELLD